MKTCIRCKQQKSLDNYRKNAKNKDGLSSYCKVCADGFIKRWRESNPEKLKLIRSRSKKRVTWREKVLVLTNYSSKETPCCAFCGESDIIVLQIDHINGGGTRHRKEIHEATGNSFYYWLIKNNYPSGYQVLCANCNTRKRWQEYNIYVGEQEA